MICTFFSFLMIFLLFSILFHLVFLLMLLTFYFHTLFYPRNTYFSSIFSLLPSFLLASLSSFLPPFLFPLFLPSFLPFYLPCFSWLYEVVHIFLKILTGLSVCSVIITLWYFVSQFILSIFILLVPCREILYLSYWVTLESFIYQIQCS